MTRMTCRLLLVPMLMTAILVALAVSASGTALGVAPRLVVFEAFMTSG